MKSLPAAEFLNVDLDLESRTDLTPLVDALGDKVFVLHSGKVRGKHLVSLELTGRLSIAQNHRTPEKCILAFSKLIERVPPTARRAWDRASLRRFDIGVHVSGGSPSGMFVEHLRAATLKRVAELNGEITFTIYPVYPTE